MVLLVLTLTTLRLTTIDYDLSHQPQGLYMLRGWRTRGESGMIRNDLESSSLIRMMKLNASVGQVVESALRSSNQIYGTQWLIWLYIIYTPSCHQKIWARRAKIFPIFPMNFIKFDRFSFCRVFAGVVSFFKVFPRGVFRVFFRVFAVFYRVLQDFIGYYRVIGPEYG